MKTKRRHELQENVLGSELAQVVEFFKRRGSTIAWGLLIATLIVFVIVYARSRSREKAVRVQEDFDRAMTDPTLTPEVREDLLKSLATQDDDDRIAALSAAGLGEIYISKMTVAGPTADPVEWKRLAGEAERWYRVVTERFAGDDLAVAKARFGLGKLAENRGDFEAARTEYRAVLAMGKIQGYEVFKRADLSIRELDELTDEVPMATTAPASKEQPEGEIPPGASAEAVEPAEEIE